MYKIDTLEYLAFVHDIELSNLLENDGNLRKLIASIPQRKIIFTNSDNVHANRVLEFFNVREYFESIVDVLALMPTVKPDPSAYKIALEKSGLESPEGCVFIDDMVENVESAADLGFYSILVGDTHNHLPSIKDIFALPSLLSAES